jgi:hypothetical protein
MLRCTDPAGFGAGFGWGVKTFLPNKPVLICRITPTTGLPNGIENLMAIVYPSNPPIRELVTLVTPLTIEPTF